MLIRAISSVVERLPYKEEVAGSNPASPTFKLPGNDGILRETRAGQGPSLALLLQPCCNLSEVTLTIALLPPHRRSPACRGVHGRRCSG